MMIETLGQLILSDQGDELKKLQQERDRLRLEVSMTYFDCYR
jgi:hypothetical protein